MMMMMTLVLVKTQSTNLLFQSWRKKVKHCQKKCARSNSMAFSSSSAPDNHLKTPKFPCKLKNLWDESNIVWDSDEPKNSPAEPTQTPAKKKKITKNDASKNTKTTNLKDTQYLQSQNFISGAVILQECADTIDATMRNLEDVCANLPESNWFHRRCLKRAIQKLNEADSELYGGITGDNFVTENRNRKKEA
jgi:hypothetical protein